MGYVVSIYSFRNREVKVFGPRSMRPRFQSVFASASGVAEAMPDKTPDEKLGFDYPVACCDKGSRACPGVFTIDLPASLSNSGEDHG